jgi:predicted AlkP superfamily phosphohydrolase/phosphomutase
MAKKNKVLLIGLDAAEPSLIEKWTAEGLLPNIKKLRGKGAYSRIGSPDEHLVGLPWPTFYTGMNPGNHGAYHYLQWNPKTMSSERIGRPWLPLYPFWRNFKDKDPRAVVIDVPLAPIVEKFNGIEINGWATHEILVPLNAYPGGILNWVEKNIGTPPRFEERYGRLSAKELFQIRDKLIDMTQKVTLLSKSLMARESWNLFMVIYSATHRGGHKLWSQKGIGPDEHENEKQNVFRSLREVYIACDNAIGDLVSDVKDNVTIFVISLHGMGFHHSRTEILPDMLEKIIRNETNRPSSQRPKNLNRIRNLIPSLIRHAVKSRMPHRIQDALTSFWRMGGTDWSKSPVICLLGDYDGYLRINLKGRESQGIVEAGQDFEDWVNKVSEGLYSFIDVDSKEPIVKTVLRRGDLGLKGSCLDHLPDLIVQWQETPPYKHREIKSPLYGSILWPTPGRNPEGRSGNHRPQGFLIVKGDRFRSGSSLGSVDIIDLAPTILNIMGLPVPSKMEGKIIHRKS